MAFWLGVAAVAVAVIGAGVSTYAAYEQAQSVTEANKAVSKLREQEAESQRQAAAFEERQFRRRIAILAGRQRAQIGALGLDPTSGSPLLIELDTARQGEIEALNIRRTGLVGAAASSFEARLARSRADSSSGMFSAVGTGLSGAGSVLSQWARGYGSGSTPAVSGGYSGGSYAWDGPY